MGELELALDLLADAKLLLENARHRSAVSRSYYAAYHACIALLESLGLKPGNFIGRDRTACPALGAWHCDSTGRQQREFDSRALIWFGHAPYLDVFS